MNYTIPIYTDSDEYLSPEKKGNYFLSPSLRYYMNLIRIVYKSNRFVSKNIYDGNNWALSSYWIIDALEKVGINLHFEGMKNIKSFDGPAVFIGNHMSTLETMVLPAIINPVKPVVFIMKEELVKYPLFGPVSAARHPILVGRTNPREDLLKAIEDGASRIKDGRSIIVFPQKTRSSSLECRSFNTLGEKIAKKNDVPVIPVAIVSDAWGNSPIKAIKDFGRIDPAKKVHFSFGEPIRVTGSGSDEHQAVLTFIKNKFIEWGRKESIVE